MWRHGVCGDDPAPFFQVVRDREFIVVVARGGVEAEGDEGEAFAAGFGHDDESQMFEASAEVVGDLDQVCHYGGVAFAAKADQLIVLAYHLGGALGEVEGEGGLVRAEVVYVEDELFGEVFGGTPYHPADAGVDKALWRGLDEEGRGRGWFDIRLKVVGRGSVDRD